MLVTLSSPALTATLGLVLAATGPAARPLVVATAPLWAPPGGGSSGTSAPRRARKRPPVPAEHPAPRPRGNSTEALEAQVFGDEPTPQVRKAPTRAQSSDEDQDGDEDEDDDRPARGAAMVLPPVIAPHLIALGLGTSLMGRSFSFDAPLQPESSFPRGGLVAALESYPLLRARGWFARLGVGAAFGTEIGTSGVAQPDGATLSYPVSERRWELDLRYAVPLGQRFLLVPRFGYGRSSYDLDRRGQQPAPSACAANSTQVCIPDVGVSHLALGFDARFAATSRLGLSLAAAFLPAFGVGRGMGQLGAESAASARGFSGELAVSWQLLDWLALRAALPMVSYSYQFSGRALSYTSASETYYGVTAGAVVFAR